MIDGERKFEDPFLCPGCGSRIDKGTGTSTNGDEEWESRANRLCGLLDTIGIFSDSPKGKEWIRKESLGDQLTKVTIEKSRIKGLTEMQSDLWAAIEQLQIQMDKLEGK